MVVRSTWTTEKVTFSMNYMGLLGRKPASRVSDQVMLKPACSATETSQNAENLYEASLNIILWRK